MAKASRKGKQTKIPGTERSDTIPELEELATKYVDVRDRRMVLTKEEVKLRDELLAVMKANKLTKYLCDEEELEINVVAKDEKVKVRRIELEDEFPEDGAEPAL